VHWLAVNTGLVRLMDINHIKSLIDVMAQSGLAEMEVGKDGWTLRLVRRHEASEAPLALGPKRLTVAQPLGEHDLEKSLGTPDGPGTLDKLPISAPLAGTVYLSPSPGEPAFVEIGQTVRAGTTVCVIEAMKVFNEVKAERDGTVGAVLIAAGDEVDAGQPLFRID
jgi:acetyl-CoA carboxylase biotin carboxyl carrier protein